MNINEINDIIADLEESDTVFENIQELAYLYIVRNNLMKEPDNIVMEYKDILPEYHKYVNIKRQYQLDNSTEEAVLKAIKSVSKEIKEFIETLYNNTDLEKERRQIRYMIEALNTEFVDK